MRFKLLKLILICFFCTACFTNTDNKKKKVVVNNLEKVDTSVKLKIDTLKEKTPKYNKLNKSYNPSLDTLKKFSVEIKIKSKNLQENIPSYITKFTIQNAIQANSEKATKYVMVILLKQYLYHLKCCNQAYYYDVNSKKTTASKIIVEHFFFIASSYLHKNYGRKQEAASSLEPYFWALESNFAKGDENIQQLLNEIQKERERRNSELQNY